MWNSKSNPMSSRVTVLAELAQRVGFPFDETELSPLLRKRVGELTDQLQNLDSKEQGLAQAIDNGKSDYQEILWMVGILPGGVTALVGLGALMFNASLGLILVAIGLGIIIAVNARVIGPKRKNVRSLIQSSNAEISALKDSQNLELRALAGAIFNELSTAHATKTSPTTFSSPQLFKETIIKEVVMIPCPHCQSLMPNTSLYCPNCGAPKKK